MQVIAVCPFLAVDHNSRRQWFIRQLTRAPVTLGALAAALGRLPTFLKRLLVSSYTGLCSASNLQQSVTQYYLRASRFVCTAVAARAIFSCSSRTFAAMT